MSDSTCPPTPRIDWELFAADVRARLGQQSLRDGCVAIGWPVRSAPLLQRATKGRGLRLEHWGDLIVWMQTDPRRYIVGLDPDEGERRAWAGGYRQATMEMRGAVGAALIGFAGEAASDD